MTELGLLHPLHAWDDPAHLRPFKGEGWIPQDELYSVPYLCPFDSPFFFWYLCSMEEGINQETRRKSFKIKAPRNTQNSINT